MKAFRFSSQVIALTRLNIRLALRDPLVFVILLISPNLMIAALGRTLGASVPFGRSPYDFAVPAASIFFLFFLTTATIHMVHRDIYWMTWSRVVGMSSTRAVILSKFLAAVTIGLIQLLSVWLLSALFYGYNGLLRPGVVLAGILFCAVTASAGLVFSTIGGSLESSASLANLSVLVFGVAGGALVPAGNLPRAIALLGWISPHPWAMDAIASAYRNGGIAWAPLGVLALMAVVLYALADARLRFHKLARSA